MSEGIMEGKWTPGPWRVEQDTALVWGECVDGLEGSYGMGVPVAEAKSSCDRGWGRQIEWEERVANARLIATAPELYSCVVAALNMVDGDGNPPDWDTLRLIAKKARGEVK